MLKLILADEGNYEGFFLLYKGFYQLFFSYMWFKMFFVYTIGFQGFYNGVKGMKSRPIISINISIISLYLIYHFHLSIIYIYLIYLSIISRYRHHYYDLFL